LLHNRKQNEQAEKAQKTKALELSAAYMKNTNKIRVEGSLEVKLPTIWADEKQSRAEAERRERSEERRVEEKE